MILQGSGDGVFAAETTGSYNDGEWHYIRLLRTGNTAVLYDDMNGPLAVVEYGRFFHKLT